MKQPLLYLTAIAIFFILFTGCQKEPQQPKEAPNITGLAARTAELSRSSWLLDSVILTYGPNHISSSGGDPCKEEDKFYFHNGGVADVQYGPVNCSGTETSGAYGNWEMYSNGDSLKLSYTRHMPGGYDAGDMIHYVVNFINSQKLVITYEEVDPQKTYLVTEIYTR